METKTHFRNLISARTELNSEFNYEFNSKRHKLGQIQKYRKKHIFFENEENCENEIFIH